MSIILQLKIESLPSRDISLYNKEKILNFKVSKEIKSFKCISPASLTLKHSVAINIKVY